MITIKNTQRKIPINITELKRDARLVLSELNYNDFDLGIWLTTNQTIRRYNKKYRKKDKPTDILSFAYHSDLKPGKRIIPQSDDDKNLGDLIISLEYTKKDAPRWGSTFKQRMKVLLVHGICHLLGYDHEKEQDYQVMHRLEKRLLKIIQ